MQSGFYEIVEPRVQTQAIGIYSVVKLSARQQRRLLRCVDSRATAMEGLVGCMWLEIGKM